MDVGLDQAGTGEASAGVVDRALGGKPALDRDDAAFLDADIQRTLGRTIGQARIADDQIHGYSALMLAALISGHHFSISALWWAASASAVCCSRGGISWPRPMSRAAPPDRPARPWRRR